MTATILVATNSGCRSFTGAVEGALELPGRPVWGLTPASDGGLLGIVDATEIWHRSRELEWSRIARTHTVLASLVSFGGKILAGAMNEATLFCIAGDADFLRVGGFDRVADRDKWFANGPPLHVRSLAATHDAAALIAAVRGVPVSNDGGLSWLPTLPFQYDVHEVKTHPSLPLVAAACAVGLCLSYDGGATWKKVEGPKESLAVAVLDGEVLYSVQEGGAFAQASQIWRYKLADQTAQLVSDGLPTWLQGKTDTGHLTAGRGQAALVDAGGDLWASQQGSTSWEQVARALPEVYGVLII